MTRQLKVHTVMRRDFGAILATTRLWRAREATMKRHWGTLKRQRRDSQATARRHLSANRPPVRVEGCGRIGASGSVRRAAWSASALVRQR